MTVSNSDSFVGSAQNSAGRRGKSRWGLMAGASVLGLGLAAAAAPQPGTAPPQPAAPISILPEQSVPQGEPVPPEPSIDVGDLVAPGVDRIGLVDTSVGGFSAQLWRGTDLELLKQVLPQLPRRLASPALRHLTKNLLLSPGAPPSVQIQSADAANAAPDSTGTGDETLSASQWLLETRVSTLAGLGDWADVNALLDLVPADQMTEGLLRYRTESNLVTNHVSDACAQTQAALNATPDTYWQKVQVFCQLDINQGNAASLGLALLREQRVEDPVFYWAVDVLGGGRPPLPAGFTRIEPLHFAMLRKAGAVLPANSADVQAKIADPATLGWLAALPLPEDAAIKGDKTPATVRRDRRRSLEEARIVLAERAVAVGTLGPETLRAVYRSVNIKDPPPPPLTQITAADARGRAFLFQSALAQSVAAARAEVIALALDLVRADRGEKGPNLTVMGPVYAEMLAEMEPGADLVWFSGVAARGLLAAGPADKAAMNKARIWLDLARNMARTSREASQIADGLWPIDRLLTGDGSPIPPQALRAWAAAFPPSTPAETIAASQELVLSLLTAVGEPVTSADWLPVMGGAVLANIGDLIMPHMWNGLALAAKDHRAGEVVALALVVLGEAGPAEAALPALQHVIESLRAAGRESDARAVAVETLLALGL